MTLVKDDREVERVFQFGGCCVWSDLSNHVTTDSKGVWLDDCKAGIELQSLHGLQFVKLCDRRVLKLTNEITAPGQRCQSFVDFSELSPVVGKRHDQRLVVAGRDIQRQTKILQQWKPEVVCTGIALLRVQVGDAVHRTDHFRGGEIEWAAERKTR